MYSRSFVFPLRAPVGGNLFSRFTDSILGFYITRMVMYHVPQS
jgi:hypothetical protein